MVGRQLPFIALLLPFYVIGIYGGRRSIRTLWPVLLISGGSFAATQFLVSNLVSYVLTDVLVAHLPLGRPLYTDGELTDEPEQVLVAELIREAVLEGVRYELPHSIAVVVEEMGPRPDRDGLTDVHALMYVERPSQKSIVIGAKGARLKEVGTRARQQIEALLGTRVYLDLRVKVAKDWQRDPKQLRRLGFYD